MTRGSRRRWSLALLALSLLAAPRAQAEVEIYRPRNRPAEELAPLASGILAPEGSAMADPGTGSLVLEGPAAALGEALELIRRLDVPVASYRIDSVVTTAGELLALGIGLDGWIEIGDLRVGRAPDPGVAPELQGLFDQTRSRIRTQVSVLEGHPGEIWTGALIAPRVQMWEEKDEQGARTRVLATLPSLDLRSGLRVRARSLGTGLVDLEITPVVQRGRKGDIDLVGAATRIRMRPGEIVAVAGTSRRRLEGGTGLPADAHYARDTAETAILVRVEVISARE